MATVIKFDIPKFDAKMSFNIWKAQIMAVLTQNGSKKVLGGKATKPESMTDEQWKDLDKKALSTIQLRLVPPVLCKLLGKTTTASLWLKPCI